MIVWINGSFGAGKTTLAEEVSSRLGDRAMTVDPELLGFTLREIVPPADTGDFQDLQVWRTLTKHLLHEINHEYDHTLVVPMTLVRPEYLEQIIGGLRAAGNDVRHFFLTLDALLLRQRIEAQILTPDDPEREIVVRQWRLDQVERCLAAIEHMPAGTVFLDSGTHTPTQLADQVLAALEG